ncbi:mechanosensitive ion channel family protein [Vibrio metschnikovii]|uniref:mechanosensitive ion channel family protein n=1 Tax=Vibrio metschnikovii TaxID=28172 RepID=UPI0020C6D173|nr:mechanosensitive ion channel family protein [Vibrio metschnikovii]
MLNSFSEKISLDLMEKGYVVSSGIVMLMVYLSTTLILYPTIKILFFHIIKKLKNKSGFFYYLDDNLFFNRLYNLIFLVIISGLAVGVSSHYIDSYSQFIETSFKVLIAVFSVLCIYAFLNSVEIYFKKKTSLFKSIPIKGIVQTIKIVVWIVASLFIISFLIGKSPAFLLSSLGAASAIIMLIFKDAILGFVAGIQLSANKMLSVGDWLEMPQYEADGEVIDITLTTVKISNWDNTISTIPAYSLISDSFKNWKGMQESGGRRIKRSILIDTTSVKFLDSQLFDKLSQIDIIKNYLSDKIQEVKLSNAEVDISDINNRRLTNLGTFRAYLEQYLINNPNIHDGFMIMVRQMAPNEHGVPLEIYCFSNDIRWAVYEKIQSDVFDHIFAILSLFELRVYQNPTSFDVRSLNKSH